MVCSKYMYHMVCRTTYNRLQTMDWNVSVKHIFLCSWITGEWQSCSKSCGGGMSRRHLYCVEELHGKSFRRIYDGLCHTPKPKTKKPCNQYSCPRWYAGQWSPVSYLSHSRTQIIGMYCRSFCFVDLYVV